MSDTTGSSEKQPLVTLGSGAPATLDYQLPQKTAFSLFGRIPGNVKRSWFVEGCLKEPESHWWKEIGQLEPVAIDREIEKTLLGYPSGLGLVAPTAGLARPLPAKQAAQLVTKASPARANLPAGLAPSPAARVAAAAEVGQPVAKAPQQLQSEMIAGAISSGLRPVPAEHFGGRVDLVYLPKPVTPAPRILVIEEYRVASYLGNYGAGKTVQTFSLLPGEKTTISIRTYEDRTESSTESQSILDSFSEESAEEFEQTLQEESGEDQETSTSFGTSASADLGVDVNLLGLLGVDAGGGVEAEADTSTTRHSFANSISSALEKHVSSASSQREVEVNTTSTASVSSGEEQTIARTLENINSSRVLNFVFRQLQQEYITLTYLANVKFVYTNGYPETTEMVDLPELMNLLRAKIKPEHLKDAFAALMKPYCSVYNHEDKRFSFIERVTEEFTDCPFAKPGETFSYWRRARGLSDEVRGIVVPGVILNVTTSILQTPSVIAEALLGQGEGLDRHNQDLQRAAVEAAQLTNEKVTLGLETVRAVSDPAQRAAAYAQVFAPPPAAAEGVGDA